MRIELNVTDANGQVDPDSFADQANAIEQALLLLNTSATGTLYSKTAYFPAGTYYISSNLLSIASKGATLPM
jgi:hypothetical protein